MASILDAISCPADLRELPPEQIPEVADALRSEIVEVISKTGGHLAASLGVPTVGVHLTTDPARNGPMGDRVAVVSGAAPGRRPGGSATTGPARKVPSTEIWSAIDDLLGSQE